MPKEILTLQNLSKFYTGSQSVVVGLNNINLSFYQGEFVAVTGESGSGKSTLAHVLGGILPYESGELLIEGKPTSHYDGADWERYRRDNVSFISQSYGIIPGSTVMGNVVSALRLTGMTAEQAKARAEEILKEVELWDMRGRRAAKLSSGQKQRLSIARALAKPAPVLLADEPTGNLDAANSEKIISLLAQAARDRLVLLITHEFSEVEHLATRHISLQDGRIVMDVPLRTAEETEKQTKGASLQESHGQPSGQSDPSPKRQGGLGRYMAGVQIGSRPMWSAAMLAFFALTTFAVFAFLGTFVTALDDTPTRIYDNTAFRNGDKQRIVVVYEDGRVMEEADAEVLSTVKHVEAVEPYGYVRDVNYAYRENIDYTVDYSLKNIGSSVDTSYVEIQSVSLKSNMPFVQTIPVLAEGQEFLTDGRLPETMYEVVAGRGAGQIGDVISVYLQDQKNWSVKDYIHLEVTVVGVTELGQGLYFHRDLGRILTNAVAIGSKVYENTLYAPVYDEDFEGKFRFEITTYNWLLSRNRFNEGNMFSFYTKFDEDGMPVTDSLITLECVGYHDSTLLTYMQVSPDLFEELTRDDLADQMSVTIEDYAYTDRVIREIEALGYKAVSPFQQSSTKQNEQLAKERMQTLRISLVVLTVVLVLQVVVLRAMFGMEMESYRLFSNIGLDCTTAQRSVFWQMIAFMAGGQLMGMAGIFLCGQAGVSQIRAVLRYITVWHGVMLWAVHTVACVLTTLWMMHSLRRQVYPFAAVEYDLEMGQEAEA